MRPLLSRIFFCSLPLIFATSCVTDNDLNEAEIPLDTFFLETSIIDKELMDGFEPTDVDGERMFRDSIELRAHTQEFIENTFNKIHLTSTITNEQNHDYLVGMVFLDELDNTTLSIEVPVSAGSDEFPKVVTYRLIIEEPELEKFLESTHVAYKLQPQADSTSVHGNSMGSLKLKTSTTYYFEH